MRPAAAFCLLGIVGIGLSACGDEPDDSAQRKVQVGGKILERSITDEMLPYDTVTSQAPRAKPKESKASDTANEASAADTSETTPAEE